MAQEKTKKLAKKEKRKILITRIICSALALLMIGSAAYSALVFLLP